MTDSPRAQQARLLVLTLLLLNLPIVLLLASSQVRWVPGAPALGVTLLLLGYAVTQGLVLHGAVTPWVDGAGPQVADLGLVLSTVALAGPLTLLAEPSAVPWSWVAGFAVGALVVLHPCGRGAVLVAAVVLGGGAVSVLLGGGLRDLLVLTLVTAVGVAGMGALTVWLLRLLIASETGREARTALAVTQERLRLTRDLHDVLAQNLTVIALKAELVADLTVADSAASSGQAREIRTLAEAGLQRARATLRGHDPLDLDEQLRTAVRVLASAGIATQVDATPVGTGDASRYLAAVVREGATNVLRHSGATTCAITVTTGPGGARLAMTNDRPHPPTGPSGTGLRGLAERGHPLGACVSSAVVGESFVLQVDVPRGSA